MLTLKYTDKGLIFSVENNGNALPFDNWSDTDDCIYYLPLATLVDNGFAKIESDECIVPFESVYLLDMDDRDILGIPKPYDKALRLRGLSMLNQSDFSYQIDYLTHVPGGDTLSYNLKGNILQNEISTYLLSLEQYKLVLAIREFNSIPEEKKSAEFNMRQFAQIKKLAIQAECELDSYLQNENVYVPDQVKIHIDRDENGFTIEPSLDISENIQFQNTFERMRKVSSLYPLQRETGERVRVVLGEEQKKDLANLKSKGGRHRTREDIQKIIEHPTEFFDPETFDLSELYSNRVLEIGVYKPKVSPFISPYKSKWIAGATIESGQEGTARIIINNEETLEQFRAVVASAEAQGAETVTFLDAEMSIEDAHFLIELAEEQLSNSDKPIDVDAIYSKTARKILIIRENNELLEYGEEDKVIERDSQYTLYGNPHFNSEYSLKEHQKEGIAWLQYLYLNHAEGCLMADDMGLGKTLQILYFIDWHSRTYANHKPYLIVAPISLLENWEKEYARFFANPRMKVTTLTSSDVPRRYNPEIVDYIQSMDIILTNYETMRNCQMNFCAVEFEIVALDEAQKIKTPGTMVTCAAKALKSNFKIAMTGTPVENTLMDLWCIMDFCVPGYLGNAQAFARKYQYPLHKAETDIVALGNEVHEKLGIYLMRRLKKDVAKDLPIKHIVRDKKEMPAIQQNQYTEVVNNYISGVQPNILITIMQLKEISEHPFLFDGTLLDHNYIELIDSAARIQSTISFLDKIKTANEKVILFAERKDSQKMLRKVCFERYNIIPKIINGDTPAISNTLYPSAETRQSSIDSFQSVPGFNIIIMSPIAAGMGLNVTAANHVIHYSRHWNPAKESQATDRAYRIGQTKDVYVYFPMAVSSRFTAFDETLDDLLDRKNQLASSTIFPTESVEVTQEELGKILLHA